MHRLNTYLVLFATLLPAAAWSQPYAKLSLGYADANFPLGAPYNGIIDDGSVQYGFDFGVGFGKKWAVELGVDGYSGFDGIATPCPANTSCAQVSRPISNNDQTVYKAAVVRRFMLGDKAQFYGKAGYYSAHIETNIGLPDADFDPDGLLLGIGVLWRLRDPWNVSLETSRFDDNVSQISVGFGWGIGDRDEASASD
jgi:outer membrane protein with beta-barrel domain